MRNFFLLSIILILSISFFVGKHLREQTEVTTCTKVVSFLMKDPNYTVKCITGEDGLYIHASSYNEEAKISIETGKVEVIR